MAARLALAGGVALVGGLGLFLLLRAERVAAQSPLSLALQEPIVTEEVAELGYARHERADVLVEPPPASGTARSFLAEYYGERWSEVEARLVAAEVKLDVPYVFHPWEEAALEIGEGYRLGQEERAAIIDQRLGWPIELSVAWVRAEFDTGRSYPLTEEDLPLLDDLVADLNLEILGRAELWAGGIDVALQERFLSGKFVRMPYTNVGLETQVGFHAKSVAALGWATSTAISREEYPELARLESEIGALRRQRYERVVRFLHGRMAR
jgi:hypothetical protein